MVESERRKLAAAEAAEWWERIVRDDLSAAERQSYVSWLCESPLHVAEMICVEQVHESLVRFENWSAIEVDESDAGSADVVNLAERMRAADRPVPRPREPGFANSHDGARAPRRAVVRWGAAAAALALAVVGTLTWTLTRTVDETFSTARAERREAVLRDGSVVQMDPESQLRVRLEAHRRSIYLERGRAVFHVAKNAERPFFVYAGAASVRAVGTTFGVEQRPEDIVVTVAEGRVMVAAAEPAAGRSSRPAVADASARPAVYLNADQQVVVDGAGLAGPVRTVSSSRELAWAAGRLVVADRTVADIVRDFNRYNRLQLQLDAPRLATQKVTGFFDAGDPESFVAYLEAGLGAHAAHSSDTLITLTD